VKQVEQVIALAPKTISAVMSPLGDVCSDAGGDEAQLSWHVTMNDPEMERLT
jgi:hypothetical protein